MFSSKKAANSRKLKLFLINYEWIKLSQQKYFEIEEKWDFILKNYLEIQEVNDHHEMH